MITGMFLEVPVLTVRSKRLDVLSQLLKSLTHLNFQISCCHLQYGFRNLSSLHVLFFFAAVPSPFALAMAPYPFSSLSQWDWEIHSPPFHALRYFFILPTPVFWARWYWEDSCHVLLDYEMCLNRNWYSSACHLGLMWTKQWTVHSEEPCLAGLKDSLGVGSWTFSFLMSVFPLVCCF